MKYAAEPNPRTEPAERETVTAKPVRVAVLGGTGFAGRNVLNELRGAGFVAEAFSRRTGFDLLDFANALEVLRKFNPSHVVNCAARVGSVKYVSDFAADVCDENMRMVLGVFRVAVALGGPLLVNPIANCAYPGVLDVYREEDFWSGPLHPSVLSYGATRRMMDVLSRCYRAQYGLRAVNLIVPNMYGPFDSTDPNKTHALNALVIKFVTATMANAPAVEVWGSGKPVREWLYVKDFARLVRRLVEEGGDFVEPFNVGQEYGLSVDELVGLIAAKLGFQGQVVKNTNLPDGAPKKVMSGRLFQQRFPAFKFTPLDMGIAETIEYYRSVL